MTAENASLLLKSDFVSAVEWHTTDIARKESFDEIIKEKDSLKLLGLINLITRKKIEKSDESKKLRAADEKALNDAKILILKEFSYVLQKTEDEILKMITQK